MRLAAKILIPELTERRYFFAAILAEHSLVPLRLRDDYSGGLRLK
jgi:hypothetical protein